MPPLHCDVSHQSPIVEALAHVRALTSLFFLLSFYVNQYLSLLSLNSLYISPLSPPYLPAHANRRRL